MKVYSNTELVVPDSSKYCVYFSNHFYFSSDTYDTLFEAIEGGKKSGFEFSVYDPQQKIVGFYELFRGWVGN